MSTKLLPSLETMLLSVRRRPFNNTKVEPSPNPLRLRFADPAIPFDKAKLDRNSDPEFTVKFAIISAT